METIEKKYRQLENDTRTVDGKTLYRVEAIKDFGSIEKGDKGGYIESEDNLSQEGECWVSGDACVSGKARVSENACVSGDACVSGNAWVLSLIHISEPTRLRQLSRMPSSA